MVIKVTDFNNLDLSQYVYQKELIAFKNNINNFDINNEIHLSKKLLKKIDTTDNGTKKDSKQ